MFDTIKFGNVLANILLPLRLRYGKSGLNYRAERAILKAGSKVVLNGPFAGMRMPERAYGSAYWPKIIGCYEAELHAIVNEIVAHNYETIIDVGCAEGYYAVGLARLNPSSKVFAFDTSADARALCQHSAEINFVTNNITIGKVCDTKVLSTFSLQNSLIICDCEGYELELLRPDVTPKLKQCDILVELHDVFYPGLTQTLLGRFSHTHHTQLLSSVERVTANFPTLRTMRKRDQSRLLDEGRSVTMQWAYMRAKNEHGAL